MTSIYVVMLSVPKDHSEPIAAFNTSKEAHSAIEEWLGFGSSDLWFDPNTTEHMLSDDEEPTDYSNSLRVCKLPLVKLSEI